ncbi:hypothetical protein VTH06DRAFT_6606 [Thermothelomyces fergusii]
MSAAKRKLPPGSLLQRRVRPRYEPEPDSDLDDLAADDPGDEDGTGRSGSESELLQQQQHDDDDLGDGGLRSGSDEGSSESESGPEDSEQEEDEEEDEDDEEDGEEEEPRIDASQLSFGALAKAQAALGSASRRKRREGAEKKDGGGDEAGGRGHPARPGPAKKPPKRPSKHAPVEMSSKKPVSRKRDFLTVTPELKKPQPRDPRFMPLGPTAGGGGGGSSSSSKIEEIKARKAYAFLDEYRESEMRQLREAIGKTRDAGERARLERALRSMESRKQAQERKDRERAVLEAHRRRERELVRQGKKPFYLKRSEQKKLALVEQFKGMKKKQVDRAIERRRKKLASKEKKLLPTARRTARDR